MDRAQSRSMIDENRAVEAKSLKPSRLTVPTKLCRETSASGAQDIGRGVTEAALGMLPGMLWRMRSGTDTGDGSGIARFIVLGASIPSHTTSRGALQGLLLESLKTSWKHCWRQSRWLWSRWLWSCWLWSRTRLQSCQRRSCQSPWLRGCLQINGVTLGTLVAVFALEPTSRDASSFKVAFVGDASLEIS